ncbi:MAG: hypothetical protein FJ008_03490 [Chloroflexi bacterium]|nr:hypothetical protein [Chloroflexota bacterium]MBM3172128.1 hypothetical protein [Chloroflexota bacterium]MBM3174595.1 hypothetical protein [Chloroflexota bacterium]MBM4449355.1 hypothetical protein [Chloroflexota bacterium]
MNKWTRWLPLVAVLSLVVLISPVVGCAPSKPTAAPAPAPAPAPQPTPSAPPTAAPPVAQGTADLVVKDLWHQQGQLFYKVANLGTAASQGGKAVLHVDGVQKSDDYVEPIAAGQEVTAVFQRWSFPGYEEKDPPKASDIGAQRLTLTAKVCIDTENTTKESNETNNCLEKVMGQPFVYNFILYATTAEWMSGNDKIQWYLSPTNEKGAAFPSNYKLEDGQFYHGALAMYPPHKSNGTIQGTFGQPYSDNPYTPAAIQEIKIPELAKFTAKVGFREDAKTDGVTVSFGYVEPNRNLVWLKTMKVNYDGKLDNFEVDLSSLAGQKALFILKVEAGASWQDDWLTWVNPRISQ